VCRPLDAVALNAGVGNSGAFLDIPWADESRLLGVDVASTVHLAKVPNIVQHGEGVLLLTSSVAATMPGPYYATYSASKAFMLSSAKALRHEVQDNGVTVTALMPGPTDTDFFDRAGMQDTPIYDADKDGPADVAKDGFEALMAGKDRVVAGSMKNRMQTAAGQVLPERARLRCTHA
jgi:short-subunit dehydrogenase